MSSAKRTVLCLTSFGYTGRGGAHGGSHEPQASQMEPSMDRRAQAPASRRPWQDPQHVFQCLSEGVRGTYMAMGLGQLSLPFGHAFFMARLVPAKNRISTEVTFCPR